MGGLRALLGLVLVTGALGVLAVNLSALRTGVPVASRRGGATLAVDVRTVRRRALAAVVEASGVAVLGVGLVVVQRPLVVLGALVLGVGALLMSVARQGVARRR